MSEESPTFNVTQEQAVVCCYYDLAIQILASMANQLVLLKQPSAARQLARTADALVEKRHGYIENTQRRIQIAAPAAQETAKP